MEGTWEGNLGFRKKFLVGDNAVILQTQEGKKSGFKLTTDYYMRRIKVRRYYYMRKMKVRRYLRREQQR